MKCLNCGKREAIKDPQRGYLPCLVCQNVNRTPEPVEITTDDIREQRKMFKNDIIQPFRDGHLSKEYVKLYGTKRLGVSKEEIDNAQNTWDDLSYYQDEGK